jgi:WD40 repeat protein
MDFSDIFKQTGNHGYFSPQGNYVATVVGHKLVIRDTETLQIVNIMVAMDQISYIEFSPDQEYILCVSYELGLIQIWEVVEPLPKSKSTGAFQPKLIAKINEGISGCTKVIWDPYSSRMILSWSEFGLRISIWNLIDGNLTYIQQPKQGDQSTCFRMDYRYFAILDRIDCKDYVCIYDCMNWELVKVREVILSHLGKHRRPDSDS